MENIIVSVIIPVFNVQKYIDCCVRSVVNQSYRNLEIILVDDASEDLSGSICDSWAERDKRIKVIHKNTNVGLSEARNSALNECTGKYLIFVDSDDVIHRDLVLTCVTIMDENKLDVVSFSFKRVNNDFVGEQEGSINSYNLISEYYGKEIIRQQIINDLFGISACNKMYRSSMFESIRFPKGLYHEDNYTIPEIMIKAKAAGVIDNELYYYRHNPLSITNTKNIKRLKDTVTAYEHTLELVSENEELYYKVMVSYLSSLANLYKASDKNERKKTLNKYKTMMKTSPKYMKTNWIFSYKLFAFAPFLYYVYVEVRKKTAEIADWLKKRG